MEPDICVHQLRLLGSITLDASCLRGTAYYRHTLEQLVVQIRLQTINLLLLVLLFPNRPILTSL